MTFPRSLTIALSTLSLSLVACSIEKTVEVGEDIADETADPTNPEELLPPDPPELPAVVAQKYAVDMPLPPDARLTSQNGEVEVCEDIDGQPVPCTTYYRINFENTYVVGTEDVFCDVTVTLDPVDLGNLPWIPNVPEGHVDANGKLQVTPTYLSAPDPADAPAPGEPGANWSSSAAYATTTNHRVAVQVSCETRNEATINDVFNTLVVPTITVTAP